MRGRIHSIYERLNRAEIRVSVNLLSLCLPVFWMELQSFSALELELTPPYFSDLSPTGLGEVGSKLTEERM
jgi:hypothetical protein